MRITAQLIIVMASLASASGAWAEDKATPSSVDTQKHSAAIANAMSQASGVQQIVSAYHQRTNAFPSTNQEASVKPGPSLASPYVKSIDVQANGVVVATLTETSGVDGGTIVFTPTVSQNTDEGVVDWKCTSPSYSTISDDTGGVCEYSKLP
ncbi:MAG: pilin [Rudaea sp.]